MATQQFKPRTNGRGIEWTDVTMNPVGGCRHGCEWVMPNGEVAHCYARDVAERGPAAPHYPGGFEAHYWREGVLKEMTAAGPPQLVFIDSMSDLMGHWVPEAQTRTVLQAMAAAPHNTFQMLTKNPRRYGRFAGELPGNAWVGASSAPDRFMGRALSRHQQERYMHVALEALTAVREATGNIVWMSVEPLSWNVAPILAQYPALDWVIIGAASSGRKYFQPAAAHVDALLDVLDARGAAVFYKGNIKPLFETWDFGTPGKNRWREDFPTRAVADVPGPAPAVVRRQRLALRYGWTPNAVLPVEPTDAPAPQGETAVVSQPGLFG
jgi:protein gp37